MKEGVLLHVAVYHDKISVLNNKNDNIIGKHVVGRGRYTEQR